MCELYALSSAVPCVPREDLNNLRLHGTSLFGNEAGWGVSWSASKQEHVLKAAESPLRSNLYKGLVISAPKSNDWMVHLRAASEGGICIENTQPYIFSLNNAQAVFAHNGDLPDIDKHPEFLKNRSEHHGNADSECAMIILRNRLLTAPDLTEMWSVFRKFSSEMQDIGPANFLVKIQGNFFVHSDVRKPVGHNELQTPGLTILIADREIRLSSEPLSGAYMPLKRGACLWIKSGQIIEQS